MKDRGIIFYESFKLDLFVLFSEICSSPFNPFSALSVLNSCTPEGRLDRVSSMEYIVPLFTPGA